VKQESSERLVSLLSERRAMLAAEWIDLVADSLAGRVSPEPV
jgi:hypothetical protein